MREFLDLGGSPNQTQLLITGKVNLLALAAVTGELETVSLLIQRGADPKSKNMHNWTALMMAATSSRPDVVRFLIEKGADLHARDDEGRTALDWALTQGETEVARVLREAGAKPGVSPGPAPSPREKPRSAREAVQQAMTILEPIGPIFHEKSGCVSCHNNSLPQAALNIALRRGIAVHPEAASHAAPATLGEFRSRVPDLMLSSCAGPAFLSLATKGSAWFQGRGDRRPVSSPMRSRRVWPACNSRTAAGGTMVLVCGRRYLSRRSMLRLWPLRRSTDTRLPACATK